MKTEHAPWRAVRETIRAALGLGRATAIARAIENDEPPAHMLAANVAAAKEPFDAALVAVDELIEAHKRDAETWGSVMQERDDARAALAAIRSNAEAWHSDDAAKARALAVIAAWAADPDSIPEAVLRASHSQASAE